MGRITESIKNITIMALTHEKLMAHLNKAMKDGRRREQMRVKIALKNIAKWRKESENEYFREFPDQKPDCEPSEGFYAGS